MCPYFSPSRSECRITPYDSSAYQDGNNKRDKVEKYPNGKFTQAIRKKRIVKKPLEAAKKF